MLLSALLLLAGAAAGQDLPATQAQAADLFAHDRVSRVVLQPTLLPDADIDAEPTEALGNFHLVAPGLYRSAQPNKEGYARLRQMGFKTILTLKGDAERERRDAGPGIKVENVPMSGFVAPKFEQVDRALDVIATAARPLLVHCQHGKDRTGFVIASYRVTVEKLPVDKAVEEAHGYGCCFIGFGDLGSFLRKYQEHRRALNDITTETQRTEENR